MTGPVIKDPHTTAQEPAAGILTLSPEEEALQSHLLDGVSRTFALTIPQLPPELRVVVSNAYLLCRIVDTIEDEPALSAEEKAVLCEQFTAVVHGTSSPDDLSAALTPRLSHHTIPAEHELIGEIPRVIRITHSFPRPQRDALERCIRIMGDGMARFQDRGEKTSLPDLPAMDRYCYHVAGVVGEMLTELFCLHLPEIDPHRERMMKLAVSFGQGLQMTNILKDIWADHDRDECWLPRETFAQYGFDLAELKTRHHSEEFNKGLGELIGVAHGHLANALDYVLMIPARESGIRRFCLWAIGMALLTLRKINHHRSFSDGDEVKISRRSVKATVLAANLTARSDLMLKMLFRLTGSGLPFSKPDLLNTAN